MFKRILKAVIASIVIFGFAIGMSILANLLVEAYPIIAMIITIVMIVCAGFVFTSY